MDLTPQTEQAWIVREWEIQELFSPAAPINEASLIAGRQAQIRALTEAVFERGRHAILFGEKGVGKTSLANTFHMMFSSGVKSVTSIRKPAFPKDTFSTLWRRVFSEIAAGDKRVSSLYLGEITPDDVVRELAGFGLNSLPIIILDEFDKFEDADAKKLMSYTIKAVSDDVTSNATLIIVGIAEDVGLLVAEHGSISRNIVEIKMPRMPRSELNQIIEQRYPRVGVSIDETTRDSIVNLSRGLPEYVHFLARDAARSAVSQRRLNVIGDDVSLAIRNMMKGADQTSEDAYNKAIHSNKKNNLYTQVLLACALARTDDLGRFVPADVLAPLTRILGRQIKMANFFPHVEAFCTAERGSIIEKKGATQAYKYRFKEPKMQPYILMKGIASDLVPNDMLNQ
jgi:Cdc6-like AAA superfamily ATPase